jgi:pimeloyl-ACP methyl ester carboxylesterase
MMEQTGWARLLPYLQSEHTVYTYDRRGRGESEDAPQYAVEREVEDLLAFTSVLPQPLDVFAHSSGALLALNAVMQGLPLRRLVLYEPLLVSVRWDETELNLPEQISELIQAGDREAALELFLRDGMEVPLEDVERIRGSDRWYSQLGYIETSVYDSEIARQFVLDAERLASIKPSTLLLAGSESPSWIKEGVLRFAEAIPGSRAEVLDGQGHNAQFTAPDLLAAAIRRFLEA